MPEDKFNWSAEDTQPIRNTDLTCKDCKSAGPRTDICLEYQTGKPRAVLDGEPCQKYKKGAAHSEK